MTETYIGTYNYGESVTESRLCVDREEGVLEVSRLTKETSSNGTLRGGTGDSLVTKSATTHKGTFRKSQWEEEAYGQRENLTHLCHLRLVYRPLRLHEGR